MAQKFKTRITVNIDTKNLSEIEKNILWIVKNASPEVAMAVAQETLERVNALGTVPVDTGKLKNTDKAMKDKFKRNYGVIGWTTPYAKSRYYGRGQKRKRVYSDKGLEVATRGKRKGQRFDVIYKKANSKGRPFWDRPVTKNKQLMISIYIKHAKRVKGFK